MLAWEEVVMCSYTLTHCLYPNGLCICVIHVGCALLHLVGGVIPCANNQRYRDLPDTNNVLKYMNT